jgi:hypothetical protein
VEDVALTANDIIKKYLIMDEYSYPTFRVALPVFDGERASEPYISHSVVAEYQHVGLVPGGKHLYYFMGLGRF